MKVNQRDPANILRIGLAQRWAGVLLIGVLVLSVLMSSVYNVFKMNRANVLVSPSLHGENHLEPPLLLEASPYLQGLVAFHSQNWKEANNYFETAISTHGSLARNYMLRSRMADGEWESLLDQLDLSIQSDHSVFVQVVAEHWDEMSVSQRVTLFEKLKQNPDLASGYLHQLLSLGKFDEVIQQGTLLDGGEQTQVKLMIGRAYFYKRDYESAASVFQAIVVRQPSLDNTIWLGKSLFSSGRQEEGLQYLEAILQEPAGRRYIPYLVDLIVAYAVAGRCFDAQEVLNEAVENDRIGAHHALLESAKQTVSDRCQG